MSWQEASSINLLYKLLSSDVFDPWSRMLHLGPGCGWIQLLQDWSMNQWEASEE